MRDSFSPTSLPLCFLTAVTESKRPGSNRLHAVGELSLIAPFQVLKPVAPLHLLVDTIGPAGSGTTAQRSSSTLDVLATDRRDGIQKGVGS